MEAVLYEYYLNLLSAAKGTVESGRQYNSTYSHGPVSVLTSQKVARKLIKFSHGQGPAFQKIG